MPKEHGASSVDSSVRVNSENSYFIENELLSQGEMYYVNNFLPFILTSGILSVKSWNYDAYMT